MPLQALDRVVTPRPSVARGSARVESQVDGGPQVKPRSSAVLRLKVGVTQLGPHLLQALLTEDDLGVLPRLSAAPEECVSEAMKDGSPAPIAGVAGPLTAVCLSWSTT